MFGALTTWAVWMLVRHLKGGLFAMFLALTAVTLSVIMQINILYQPNSFDILSWTLVYLSLIKYLDTRKRLWIWSTGLVFAIGFLNKYNIVFLLAGLIPGLLLTKSRFIFLKKDLYFAAVIALILIFPNLLWQYQNQFPVVHHMKELAETQLINVDRFEFVKEQFLFFIGALFVLIAALLSFISYPPFRQFRFLYFSFFITLLTFIYFRAKGYYAIGLYPVLLAFGAVYIEHLTKEGWKLYLRPVAVLIPMLLFIPVVKRAFPIYSPAELELQAEQSGKMHTRECAGIWNNHLRAIRTQVSGE
jgi:4-amino-4-deoxy-L-arabinose transferase-like glycosyltransferase